MINMVLVPVKPAEQSFAEVRRRALRPFGVDFLIPPLDRDCIGLPLAKRVSFFFLGRADSGLDDLPPEVWAGELAGRLGE